MKKIVALIAGLLLPCAAFGQSSGISWVNGRVLTAHMMQQFDDAKMNLNSLGKPEFAAKLNAQGQIDAPINTESASISIMRAGFYAGGESYAGTMPASPLFSIGANSSESGADFDLPGDNPPYQWAEILGGQHADAKAFRWQVGQPDSGNLGAVVDFVAMNGMSLGQGTGVSAGSFVTMLNYMNFDAAARATRTGATPPKFVASTAIADPDGNTHAVTFSPTGATFSPALPAYWGRMIHAGMNVATNEIGIKSIPQNTWNMPWFSDGFRRTYNMYFGTIKSWNTNSDGTIAGITVDGWVIPQQETYGYGSATGKTPGVDTLDGSSPALDTTFTAINKPAILFGIYTKAFTQYELCDLNQKSRGDINDPNGTVNNLVHECDHEVDMRSNATTDHVDSIHGYTLAIAGSHELTHDSYGFTVAGGGILPLGYHARNLVAGSPSFQAMANGSITQSNLYAPYAVGADAGDTSLLQTWGNELATGGINTSTLRLIQYRDVADNAVSSEDGNAAQSKVSLHLQWKKDSTKNPAEENGAIGGQFVYNPHGYMYGIGIGAGGTFKDPNYGLIIDKTGAAYLPTGGTVQNGKGIGFVPSSGDSRGHSYIAAIDATSIKVAASAGGMAGVSTGDLSVTGAETVSGAITSAGYTATAGQGVGMVPASGDTSGHPFFYAVDNYHLILGSSAGAESALKLGDIKIDGSGKVGGRLDVASDIAATGILSSSKQINNAVAPYANLTLLRTVGTQEFCTDCYSSSNATKTLGIPVWWNGSTWVDALGQAAQW